MLKKQLPNTFLLSYGAIILANLIWAAAGPIIKLTLQYIPPFTFLFFRFLLVALILLPISLLELKKTKVYVQDYWKIFLFGLFSQTSIAFIFWGLKYTTAVDAALIGAIGVLLSMAAGHYFYYEKFNTGIKLGLLIAITGTFVVIIEPLLSVGHISESSPVLRIWGNFLILLNHLAFLLYIIWSKISLGENTKVIKKTLHFIHIKPMKGRYSTTLLTSLAFYVGLLTLLPLALLENIGVFGYINYDLTNLPPDAYLGIAFMAIFSSIVAYYSFEWALKKVSVSDTAILGYVSSVFGIPFAYLILKEVPTYYGLLGALIIVAGIVTAEVSAHAARVNNKFWFWKLFKR